MNHFLALKKPEKPVEIWSPPNSPQAQNSLFLTPKFSAIENRNLIIESLSSENIELKNRILELTNSLKQANINHKIEIKNIIDQHKGQGLTIQEKYDQTQFVSRISPLTKKCSEKIDLVLNFLKGFSDINKSVEREVSNHNFEEERNNSSLAQEEGINASLIQEEGKVSDFANNQGGDPFLNYESQDFKLKSDSENYAKIVEKKDKEIRKHKDFIKMLKNSLENILMEHSKSKMENEKHIKEIAELKAQLALERN